MGAPRGNQFWKLRSTHGREKLFSSPEVLWDAACEYFEWCDKHPLQEQDWVGKDGRPVKKNLVRAYTWSGLEYYLGVSSLREYKTNEKYKDFFQVIARIEQVIYTQKFEAAAAGLLNANIIARDLGLIEKTENKNENTNKNYKVSLKIQ